MNRRNRLLQKGASMIEVMLSLAVVGVGMLTVAHVQTGIFTQVGDNKARVEATVLAQARIEDMRNYTNLATNRTEFDVLLAAGNIWQTLVRAESAQAPFRVRIVADTTETFTCGNGIPVAPDCAVDDDPEADIVILPELWLGPDDDLRGRYLELMDWLRRCQ